MNNNRPVIVGDFIETDAAKYRVLRIVNPQSFTSQERLDSFLKNTLYLIRQNDPFVYMVDQVIDASFEDIQTIQKEETHEIQNTDNGTSGVVT